MYPNRIVFAIAFFASAVTATAAVAPRSLLGTEPDGAVVVTVAGDLMPGPELLLLFDHFLTATGEQPTAEIRQRIVDHLRRSTHGEAAWQAELLVDKYLQYRLRAGDLARTSAPGEGVDEIHGRLRALRREVFTDDADALFSDIEAEERFGRALDAHRRGVAKSDPKELLALLPEVDREARRRATRALDLMAAEEMARAAGAAAGEIHRLRAEVADEKVAQRLAGMEAERFLWRDRVETYRHQRAALEPLDAASLEVLRRKNFTGPELIRVRALDRLAGLDE